MAEAAAAPGSGLSASMPALPVHMRPVDVIFLVGMLRSGTTMLAHLLSQHDDVVAVGELSNVWRSVQHGGHCQCGAKVARCPFWGSAVATALAEASLKDVTDVLALRQRVSRSRHFIANEASGSRWRTADRAQYVDLIASLHGIIRQQARAAILVDTSKTPFELQIADEVSRVLAVQLIRSPYGVAASERDGRKFSTTPIADRPPARGAASSAAHWTLMNLQAEYVRSRTAAPGVRLFYEEFAHAPEQSLKALARLAGLPTFAWRTRDRQAYFPAGHIVNGNPSRRLVGWQAVQQPAMGSELGGPETQLVRAITSPLRRYGYRRPVCG